MSEDPTMCTFVVFNEATGVLTYVQHVSHPAGSWMVEEWEGCILEGHAVKKIAYAPGLEPGDRLIDAVFGTTKEQQDHARNKIENFPY